MADARFTVVGGGLAGLMTAIKLAEAGQQVDLLSIVPVKRSHSVCAQGGINGAVNTKGEGDHPDIHVKDTLRGGDFLAEQTSVKGMCYAAPHIIYMLDRMGVPFNRTPEGLLDFRRFGGTLHHRTAFAGATTRWTNRSAATRRRARSPSTSTGSGWGWCATRAAAASAAWPWTCAPTRSAPSRRRR
jgi:succinate dehydrogenase / fumarate reductase flavoprotein subunit